MEELLIGLVAVLVVVLVVAPIASLVVALHIRRKQQELAAALQALQQTLAAEYAGRAREKGSPGLGAAAAPMTEPSQIMPASAAAKPPAAPPLPPSAAALKTAAAAAPAAARIAETGPEAFKEPAAIPARQAGRLEAAAIRILRKIWNWIIVGEEHRPQGVSMEYAVATNWLLRVGVLILVVGIGFFLRYSFEHGLIGPWGRVSIGLLTGAALLTVGVRLLGRKYHLLGQGLMGAGLATLYFSVFSAFSFYHLIGMLPAFGLMILVTAGAGGMAVRFQSLLVAILGLIGGYGTPVMLATGQVQFAGLFGYMLLLGAGVFGVAYYRRWHLLNVLSFICTYALFFAALDQHYETRHCAEVLPFLIAFFVLFSTMVFIHNLVRGIPSTMLEIIALLANAGVCFGAGYWLIAGAYARQWVAALTIGLGLFYALHVQMLLTRRLKDRVLATTFVGLASFFLVVTIPLILSGAWITVSWALEAFILLWMAGRLNSEFLREIALLLYVLLLGRFFFFDLPHQFGRAAASESLSLLQYARELGARVVLFGIPIASLAGAHHLLKQPAGAMARPLAAASNVRRRVDSHGALRACILGFAVALFVYLHLELNRAFAVICPPVRLPALTLLWLAPCLLVLLGWRETRPNGVQLLLAVLVTVVLVKLVAFDMPGWHFAPLQFLYERTYSWVDTGLRLLDFGAVVLFLFYAGRLIRAGPAPESAAVFGYAALAVLFVYLTLETNTFLHHFVPGLRSGGVSVVWSGFALAIVLGGILRDARGLRFAGLGLFAIVALKIFFVDLAHLEQVYRIVAFILLGVLLLAGSFVYIKYRSRFALGKESAP